MDESKRRPDLRALFVALAVVLAVAAIWGASALAAGGSASGERGSRDSPAATTVQNESEEPDGDCPNRGSDSEESAGV